MKHCLFKSLMIAICLAAGWSFAGAQQTAPEPTPSEVPEMSDTYLNDSANIEAGKEIWQQQCRHCHGASAYPGKAPKLKPASYKPDFVYKRVSDGFRKMPAWKNVYTEEQRKQIVAWVMSESFSP